MNQIHNLSEALNFALKQDWWIFVLVIVIPIVYAYLMKKFEQWLKKKFKKKIQKNKI